MTVSEPESDDTSVPGPEFDEEVTLEPEDELEPVDPEDPPETGLQPYPEPDDGMQDEEGEQ